MLKKSLCLLLLLSFSALLIPINFKLAYASDLELIGGQDGISIKSNETKLFDLNNLNPGDVKMASININSLYKGIFELYIQAERIGKPQQYDLLDQLRLKVDYDGDTIYNGLMSEFAQTNIKLGKISENDAKRLVAQIYLPGAETGNEFQGKSADTEWIFTAQLLADELDKVPRTGQQISIIFYLIGFLLAILGIRLAVKNNS